MLKKGLLIVFALFMVNAHAELYQSIGPDGSVVYSDVPSQGAKAFTPPPVNEVPSTLPQAEPDSANGKGRPANLKDVGITPDQNVKQKLPYEVFQFETPSDQESIQNQPVFQVKFKVEPALQSGDKIQLVLDGTPFGEPNASAIISVANVDRGTHQLSAYIINGSNQIVKRTNTITIYVHRASTLNNAARKVLTPSTELRFPIQALLFKAKELIIHAT